MGRVNWIGQDATYRDKQIGNLRLVNGYAEIVESKQGKTVVSVRGTPGLQRRLTLPGAGPVRGMFTTASNRCFAVQADGLYEIDANWTATLRGTLLTSNGPVMMDENSLHLMIVDGSNGYGLTMAGNTFARIIDPDFPGSYRVGFIDNYLVFPVPNSQNFMWTDLLTLNVDALSLSTAEGFPDLITSLLVFRREVWAWGYRSLEVFYDSGDPDNVFQRIPGAFLHQGTEAAQSPARVGETVCWLSSNDQGNGIVVQASGYSPDRVSTYPIEETIQAYTVKSDAIGWGQQQNGHLFYWLTFPNAGATWVLDTSTGLWAQRAYLDPGTGVLGRHRANCYTFFNGKHLVGDYVDGRVYSLEPEVYSDDGHALAFDGVLPPFFDPDNLKLLSQDWLVADCLVGVGLDGGVTPGSDPQIVFRFSNDGGESWAFERTASLGAIGKKQQHVRIDQLGSAYDRRVGFRITDPVRRGIMGMMTQIRALRV